MVIGILLLIVVALYLLALRGRRNHPDWKKLQGWAYAHRGLHGNGVPENSMRAFRLALEKGYGIELDLHLLKDGHLAVLHDTSLKRTTGVDGFIEDLTAAELGNYRLEGTEEVIPEFSQVLALFAGKAPMIVELKAERGNAAQLCQAACDVLETYPGAYCIESFDPRCIRWLRKHRPQILRGQLSYNFMRGGHTMPWITRFILTNLLTGWLTEPDFIAYSFADRKGLSPMLSQKLWGVRSVSWTLRTQEAYDVAVREGAIPIFESFEP